MGSSNADLIWMIAILFAPPLVLSWILSKAGKNKLWSLLWFVFLGGFYIWFVASYPR